LVLVIGVRIGGLTTQAQKLGLVILPHELRHGYATHCLERGVSPRAIQQVMGHSSLETTMGYLHTEALSVPSPLDATLAQAGSSSTAL
jgi:site-specific recombinase XerD